ncbi:MAG: HAD-IC family P-type ATPase, partial [Candidatus Saccharimonadales bacterium]
DKLRIVDIVRRSGQLVAVTGDGINDAPALKSANIGVAMGRTGSDVAKDAAEIVLLDDSFDTLVAAIEQGRITYQNIRRAARCVLTSNAGELLTVLIGLSATALFHTAPAITAIQILAIDIVAQILPITALGWDRGHGNLMREQPRRLSDHIINRGAVAGFIGFGLLAAVLSYGNYLLFFARHHLSPHYLDPSLPLYHQATSLTYLTLVLCLYVYLLFERSDAHDRFFSSYLWSNRPLLYAFGGSFVLIANLFYNPLVQPYFGTASLSPVDWITALLAAAIYASARLLQRHTRQHSRRSVLHLHRQVHG